MSDNHAEQKFKDWWSAQQRDHDAKPEEYIRAREAWLAAWVAGWTTAMTSNPGSV